MKKQAGHSGRRAVPSYRTALAPFLVQLASPSHWRTLMALGADWLMIACAVGLALRYPSSITVTVLAWLVIASRQHALLVLMHEGAHGNLWKGAGNDWISNLLAAWPLGFSTGRYREHHWRHHQFTNTENDPDWGRKVNTPHWRFPKTHGQYWKGFLPYLWGLGLRELAFAYGAVGPRLRQEPLAYLYWGFLALGVYLSGLTAPVCKFWLVPAIGILPVLMKVRSIVEHLGLPYEGELSGSRNILGRGLGSFFFGPHGNSLHLVHHLFPQIPWFRLPQVHRRLQEDPAYRLRAHENDSYFLGPSSAYRDLTAQPPAGGQRNAA